MNTVALRSDKSAGQIESDKGQMVLGDVDSKSDFCAAHQGIGDGPASSGMTLGTRFFDEAFCHQLVDILGDGRKAQLQVGDKVLFCKRLVFQEMPVNIGTVNFLDFYVDWFFIGHNLNYPHFVF